MLTHTHHWYSHFIQRYLKMNNFIFYSCHTYLWHLDYRISIVKHQTSNMNHLALLPLKAMRCNCFIWCLMWLRIRWYSNIYNLYCRKPTFGWTCNYLRKQISCLSKKRSKTIMYSRNKKVLTQESLIVVIFSQRLLSYNLLPCNWGFQYLTI